MARITCPPSSREATIITLAGEALSAVIPVCLPPGSLGKIRDQGRGIGLGWFGSIRTHRGIIDAEITIHPAREVRMSGEVGASARRRSCPRSTPRGYICFKEATNGG